MNISHYCYLITLIQENCEDSLTEAMDHMQSEYLEESDNHETVQMEIVVESEDQSNSDMQVVSILPDTEDSSKESSKESRENGRAIRRGDSKLDRKSAKLLVNVYNNIKNIL